MVMPGKAVGTLSGGVIATARTPNQGVPGLARSSGDKGGVESIRLNLTDPLDPPSDASTAKWQPVASEVMNRPSNRRGHTHISGRARVGTFNGSDIPFSAIPPDLRCGKGVKFISN